MLRIAAPQNAVSKRFSSTSGAIEKTKNRALARGIEWKAIE